MQKYKTVEEFLDDLDEDKKTQVLTVRKFIMDTHSGLEEHIKWNAPSYVYGGVDRITFNLLNKDGLVKLVFHMGAVRKENKTGAPIISDESHLLEWASDIRGYATFVSFEDIKNREAGFKKFIVRWLAVS